MKTLSEKEVKNIDCIIPIVNNIRKMKVRLLNHSYLIIIFLCFIMLYKTIKKRISNTKIDPKPNDIRFVFIP
jgi:mannitol-1-phosphate/altronate dehydrogenase